MKAEQATRHQGEERISVIEQELNDAVRKCESLEKEIKPKRPNSTKLVRRPKMRGLNPERLTKKSGRPDR